MDDCVTFPQKIQFLFDTKYKQIAGVVAEIKLFVIVFRARMIHFPSLVLVTGKG